MQGFSLHWASQNADYGSGVLCGSSLIFLSLEPVFSYSTSFLPQKWAQERNIDLNPLSRRMFSAQSLDFKWTLGIKRPINNISTELNSYFMFNILWITLSHLVYLNYQLPSSESLSSLLAQERQVVYRFINFLFVIPFYYYILNVRWYKLTLLLQMEHY